MDLPSRKYETIEKRASGHFATYNGFGVKDAPCRSFLLRQEVPDGKIGQFLGPIYLTWFPGHFVIAGDAGELTLEHYSAMPSLKEAMKWLADSHIDYLARKSDAKKVYSPEDTWRDIVRWCNEDGVERLRNGTGALYLWSKLAENLIDDGYYLDGLWEAPEQPTARQRRQLRELLWSFLTSEPQAKVENFVYDLTEDIERLAANRYSDQTLFQLSLMRDFARKWIAKNREKVDAGDTQRAS